MTQLTVTHDNFDNCIEHVLSGQGELWINTSFKKIKIDKKTLNRFNRAGVQLIKKDRNSSGFMMQSGKSTVCILVGYLVFRSI